MLELSDGMLLYHGSYCEVKTPELSKCADFKDFGKGFYLTSSKEQAENFINTSLKKAKAQGMIAEEQGYGMISAFRYHYDECIADFIFCDADDATNVTILTYLVGSYGTIGSREADDLCISRLIPERLKDQFCFRTDKGLRCLSFEGSEQIWKN